MDANRYINIALLVVTIGMPLGCTSGYQAHSPIGLGKPITENQIQAWNIDVGPSGAGLPPGSSTATIGEKLYQKQCASCHGDQGQGGVANRLVGGGSLNTNSPVKTVGSFWPYSTTIFDYVKRAMPHQAPQSLTDDQVYAATAYILYLNKIIPKDAVMDAKTLPLVKMPNRDGFTLIER
ncbi:c-type cytochrome [Polynucleobacter campilacus]|uniref:Cytochrome C n=1 Tax=Polynucleobacter campilacus TaxID=1743163 RepID=A0A254PX37_9BURK|nr:cytochrome c [Polynucleobacter campilacus]OWS70844.1 cytochrome C [Polynucleobacter campilacus]